MPIQDYDVKTGKAIDPRSKQIIVAIDGENDLSLVLNVVRERRLHLLGTEKQQRAILELMRKHKIGTLILDMDLPDIDVDEIVTTMQRRQPDFSVILLSKALTKDDLEKNGQPGILGFLAKPLKRDPVVKILSNIK